MESVDIWWGLYKEQCDEGRHHETQRSTMSNLVLLVTAGVLAFTSHGGIQRDDWPLCVFLIIIGLFGALFSAKHYERFRFHMRLAQTYREKLEEAYPETELASIRSAVLKRQLQKFGVLVRAPVFVFWIALHLSVALLGGILTFKALESPIKPQLSIRGSSLSKSVKDHRLPTKSLSPRTSTNR